MFPLALIPVAVYNKISTLSALTEIKRAISIKIQVHNPKLGERINFSKSNFYIAHSNKRTLQPNRIGGLEDNIFQSVFNRMLKN